MAVMMSEEQSDGLVKKFNDSFTALKFTESEDDRVQALRLAQQIVSALEKPQDAAYKQIYQPCVTLAVRIGIDMGFFETITKKNGPTTLEEIAAVKGGDPVLCERFLRILAGIGYVGQTGKQVYTATKMTKMMTERRIIAMTKFVFDNGMISLAKLPTYLSDNHYKNPLGARGGPWQYAMATEDTIWEWLEQRPDKLQEANTLMEGDPGGRPGWLEWFPVQERVINGFECGANDVFFVDIGGGRGHDISDFKKKFPNAPGRFVLEDLPHVIDDVLDVDSSIERVKIDFFKDQPIKGARNYYLKFVLHDWSDDDCRIILQNITSAMKKGYSKLIVEEFILADKDTFLLQSMWDMQMLAFAGGMESTADQWTHLFESARLKVTKMTYPPGEGQGIIKLQLD